MNFARDVVDAAPPGRRALVALGRDGSRAEWSFGEVAEASARAAGALAARGVQREDVVMTLVGNRPEWVLAMLACFRLGAVALPCTEQLRPADLRARMDVVEPRLVVADGGHRGAVGHAGSRARGRAHPRDGAAGGFRRAAAGGPGRAPPGGRPGAGRRARPGGAR